METDLPLPETIGPYRVTGRLGRGGMGEVLRGHDDRLDRPVALKHILPDVREPETALRRFRREARAVARLAHPSIVQVYDWEEDEGQHWLVLEFVEGRSLDELIAAGPLPVDRALEIARDVASGLAEAHDAGIIHRDLKTTNVVVSTRGRAKILDFGLAKTVRLEDTGTDRAVVPDSTLTGDGQIVGTVTAMSPEQAMGKKVDHRSDLFSLGILLYEMLSGVLPFKGDSAIETLTRICSAQEEPLCELDAEIPEGVARLVTHLLEKDPAWRPRDAQEVVTAIDQLGTPDVDAGASMASSQGTTLFGLKETRPLRRLGRKIDASRLRRPGIRAGWWLATAVAVALGLWGLASWQGSVTEEEPVAPAAMATAMRPDAELSTYELYQRGMKLLERYDRKGNIAKAIDDFQRALALDDDYAPALAGLSTAYRLDFDRGGDPQLIVQSLAAAEQAVKADEHLTVARVSRGLAYVDSRELDQAVRDFEQVLMTEPSNGEALFGLAKAAEVQADFERAEKHFLRAIEAQPERWLTWSHLGSFYYSTARYEEAEGAFLKHLELARDSYIAFRNLGAVYYSQGRLVEAAEKLQESLVIQPDFSTYSNLGTIQFALGQYTKAAATFEKARDHGGSRNYLIWGNLGDAYRWSPDGQAQSREAYAWAIRLLEQEIEDAPRDPTLLTRLLLFLAKSGDCDQTREEVSKIDLVSLDERKAWYHLAVANEVCGDREAALAALERALRANFALEEANADPELMKLREDVRYQRLSFGSARDH